jgi:hypothetical protein
MRLSRGFHKPSLKPDLCTLKGLRNSAIILDQTSLLKELFLVDSVLPPKEILISVFP